jgi:hypothetical protein
MTEFLEPSTGSTHCPWKGDASYYHVAVGGTCNEDAAWYYPNPYDAASAIKGYIAFWKGVQVSGSNAGTREIRPPGRDPDRGPARDRAQAPPTARRVLARSQR